MVCRYPINCSLKLQAGIKRVVLALTLAMGCPSLHLTAQYPSSRSDMRIKVIIDTDMGSDCDDAGAMALLHSYADLGRLEIIGCIYSSVKYHTVQE